MMPTLAVAERILRQIVRDRRALALILVVPIVVMGLLAIILDDEEEDPRVAVNMSGIMDLYRRDMEDRLDGQEDEDARLSVVKLPDETSPIEALARGEVDAVLVFPRHFLEERVDGKPSTVIIHVEGSDPMRTAHVLVRLRNALSEAMDGLPRMLPADCAAHCGDTIPTLPPEMDVAELYGEHVDETVDFYTPVLPPFFVFFFVFLLSGMTFLRERISGTAERLLASPLRRSELVLGYVLGFLPAALAQSTITVLFARYALGGPWGGFAVVVTVLLLALAAECLGVFVSAYARTEFEVIQFLPIVILPQVLLCGIFWPVQDLPGWLAPVSYGFPLTYAVNAVRDSAIRGFGFGVVWPDMLALLCFALLAVVLAAITVRRTVRG